MKITYLEDFEKIADKIAEAVKGVLGKKIPTKTSQLDNDSSYVTESKMKSYAQPAGEYPLVKNTGVELVLKVDPKTYLMELELKNAGGEVISSQEFDFPIEAAFVNVDYNEDTNEIKFVLQNGTETKPIDLSNIIRGLVPDGRTIAGLNLGSDITAERLKDALGINDKLDKTGDASNTTAAFTRASMRANISTGEKLSVILGKISKYLADFKSVAFSGAYSDLSGTPDSLPASDVPSWAKASTKPSYTPTEVGVIGTAPTSGQVAVFDGTTGKVKSTGYTIEKSVPSDAKFTDTTYGAATQSAAGLQSAADKKKLDGISEGATANVAASAAPKAAGTTASAGTSEKYAREDHVHPAQTTVSGNAGTATKLSNTRDIAGIAFDGSSNIHYFGTCTTAAATAAKAATVSGGFTLAEGAMALVKMSNANTAASPTLNVNSTGAKPIMRYGATAPGTSAATSWQAGSVVLLVYDGANWLLVGWLNDNTTYSAMSTAELTAGTATTARTVRADYLSAAIKAIAKSAVPEATQSDAGVMGAADKLKLDFTNVVYGTCSTAAGTAAKAIAISGNTKWALQPGAIVIVKFTATNTASNPTFNVNDTGAKGVWYNTAVITTGSLGYAGTANRPMIFVYDGTNYVFLGWSYDANTTYTNAALGQGYGTCATAAATVEKAVTLSSYALTANGIVAVQFTNAVQAGATMNVNSKGAKPIYYKGKAIVAGTIQAGDIATFIYNGSYYHLISTDNGIGTGLTAAEVGDGDTSEISEADIDKIVAGTYK